MTSAFLSPFSEVIEAFSGGEIVIMVDDASRENEGDLVIATEKLTPEAVAFMAEHARGLICVSIPAEVAAKLQLPPQTFSNNSPFNTPFAVSVDLKDSQGQGVTAPARARAMKRLIEPDASPHDFIRPGHVFPLIANPAGVIGRQGQTEGSLDLARIAGLYPSGVICEILNPDGSMARGDDLASFARTHGLKITSVEEVLRYRVNREVLVRQLRTKIIETSWGEFVSHVFIDDVQQKEHIALTFGDLSAGKGPLLVRVHSECLTGDVFGSQRCDCGDQLARSMEKIAAEGRGVMLYLRQEGRGIGLANKLRAYALQDQGHDTVDANLKLGFDADLRDFAVAGKMLQALEVSEIRLLTNNPKKVSGLEKAGISVVERVPQIVEPTEHSASYLKTKREKLGHLL